MIFFFRNGLPRLRTILLFAHLVVLSLALLGVVFLRVLDDVVIRQTELSLLTQGRIISTLYQSIFAYDQADSPTMDTYGIPVVEKGESRLAVREDLILSSLTGKITYGVPDVTAASIVPRIESALHAVKATRCCPSYRPTQASLVDFVGVVTASKGRRVGEVMVNRSEVRLALNGRTKSVMYNDLNPPRIDVSTPFLREIVDLVVADKKVIVSVATPIILDNRVLGAVVLERAPRNVAWLIDAKRKLVFWSGISLFALIVLITLFTTLTITRPIRAVIEQTRRATQGERDAVHNLKYPITWEADVLSKSVVELSRSLEKRAEESQQRAEYIQTFADFVTHEVKNSLVPTFSAVEWLREHNASVMPDEQEQFKTKIALVERKSKEISLLVDRLDELARAEVGPIGVFDPADVLSCLELIQERYSSNQLSMEIDPTLGAKTIALPAETFQSILSSLIDNAHQHGGENANVTIKVTDAKEIDSMVSIELSDDGRGILEEHANRIFEPFFTTARETGNRGLGLAIVKALLEAHGGSIKLMPLSHGTSFQITLPSRNV